jgi:hypothetical protein
MQAGTWKQASTVLFFFFQRHVLFIFPDDFLPQYSIILPCVSGGARRGRLTKRLSFTI